MLPRTRRVQRIRLPHPLPARFGANGVLLVDLSVLGARIRHDAPIPQGQHARLSFAWEDESIEGECRVVRSRSERFEGDSVYHSGLEFVDLPESVRTTVRKLIEQSITRALIEQQRNSGGAIPQHIGERMPLFRSSSVVLPHVSGYVCFSLENKTWRRKRTHDPGQPADGFTVSAGEDQRQLDLLCDAYQRSDSDGRKLIQLFAQLSIHEGEGMS